MFMDVSFSVSDKIVVRQVCIESGVKTRTVFCNRGVNIVA